MKELFAIAFTCVYLLLTVGVNKNTTYCMGRINASVPFLGAGFSPYSSALATKENDAEFFIMNDLYSEAFVVYVT